MPSMELMTKIELRTGVWYNDRTVAIEFPDSWDVVTHWPDTPPVLQDADIDAALASPVGQAPLRDLARGKHKPVIVVDDLSRPTPVGRLMPFLFREFAAAGVPLGDIRVVVATGTHGRQDESILKKKLGPEVFETCRVVIHNHKARAKLIGKTTYGTPVYVNPVVLDGDLVIGVGGVYPQYTTGFGGGAKLALGALGMRSIASLHFGHDGVDGSYDINNSFRRDLDEVARMIRLHTMFTLHIDANQRLVNLTCGDHFAYYEKAAAFSRTRYTAPAPNGADIVIANAYPADSSLFFMRKAMTPIDRAPGNAMTVMIASNHGGLGHHGLFYPTHNPRLNAYHLSWTRLSIMDRRLILRKVLRRLGRMTRRQSGPVAGAEPAERPARRLWVYAPPGGFNGNGAAAEVTITDSWERLLSEMKQRNGGKPLKVSIYPCSSLQCIGD